LPDQTPEADFEEPTLLKSYTSIRDLSTDYKLKTRLGWKVAHIMAPDPAPRPGLPVCILRRVSQRHRYRVIYVRRRI
jgi:hypothetical protein